MYACVMFRIQSLELSKMTIFQIAHVPMHIRPRAYIHTSRHLVIDCD